ncbi:MAG: hypothetical protein FWC41_09365 [Firmicutes bacterium]|nr:hypothetical protein [Bacillota bacterium]
MKNQTNLTQDCGCSDGCCTPQKKNSPWKKWVFIAIILAAAAIITVKLVNKDVSAQENCCDKPENISCCKQSN